MFVAVNVRKGTALTGRGRKERATLVLVSENGSRPKGMATRAKIIVTKFKPDAAKLIQRNCS